LNELQRSGLPCKADVIILSISEIWLPPTVKYEDTEVFPDSDVAEYFQKYYDQIDRNLAETEVIVDQTQEELLKYFPDWKIKTEAVSGSPASLILSRAFEFKPDLIVVGAQGLSSDGQIGLGSISLKILTEAKCSVQITRAKPDVTHSRLKIMIGFDDSLGSMAAVKTVAARQWRGNPEIRLVTVTDPFFPLIPGRVLLPIPGLLEGKMKGEQKWVETLATKALQILHDAGLSATLHVYDGNPRIILVQEAEKWEADLIFIGANSLQLQSRHYSLGCVSSAVASRVSCSVEVVRQN
jgi:nucleotide-binding universal stress UspA family protein